MAEPTGSLTDLQDAIAELKRLLANQIPGDDLRKTLESYKHRLDANEQDLDELKTETAKMSVLLETASASFISTGISIRESAHQVTGQARNMQQAHMVTMEHVKELKAGFAKLMELLASKETT